MLGSLGKVIATMIREITLRSAPPPPIVGEAHAVMPAPTAYRFNWRDNHRHYAAPTQP